jgi:LmbE family N-acetylglucosaminyl deacetylase
MAMKPLVAIFAHPDDEAFGPSGTLATFAKERDVYLICVTDGDAGQNALESVTNLGETRRGELTQSAKIIGVKEVEFLGYKDGSLSNNLYHEVAEKIEKLLQKYQPDTLLTFNQLGISGHIDHIFVSLVTTFVYRKTKFVKKLLYYSELETVLGEMKDYFIYMPPGIEINEADLVVDVSSVWETKLSAINCHQSQKQDGEMIKQQLLKHPKKEYFKILQKENP